jgi:predicted enzyme related to lactoylglutathione lyase
VDVSREGLADDRADSVGGGAPLLSFLNRLRYPSPGEGGARPGSAPGSDTTPRATPPFVSEEPAPIHKPDPTGIDVLFAAVSVSDFEGALDWYTRLFGRPPDINVKGDEVMWRITEGAWLYVILDRNRAGTAVVTLSVGDLDSMSARIAARGIRTESFETVGDAGRKATFRDADGNVLSFVEVSQRKG